MDLRSDVGNMSNVDGDIGINFKLKNMTGFGYVPVSQSTVQSSKHGRNTNLFWSLVLLLFILAVGNLLTTVLILAVLRVGHGMESLEFYPSESLIKFFGKADLDHIYKRDGLIEGFKDSPMVITGDQEAVLIDLVNSDRQASSHVRVGVNETLVKNVEALEVRDPVTGYPIFSTDYPNFGLPRGVTKLDIKIAQTKRISSPVDESLTIVSDSVVKLRGNEGTHIEAKEVIWSVDQDIFLKSVNGSIILTSEDGVFIDIKNIHIVSGDADSLRSYTQYKLCVCMPSGKLFRMPVPPGQDTPVLCHIADMSPHNNPCL